jgi:hypothetical protein
MTRHGLLALGSWLLGVILVPTLASAQIEMPDALLIHGRALPAPELPNGTVTVRVVREAIGNDIAGQQVTITVGGAARTATTDAEGRAEFPGLELRAEARARAVVDGEELLSEPFSVPASGGLRVILVAGIKEAAARREKEAAAAAAAPAVRGQVVIGGNSRILMEFQNDGLTIFYLLEVLNNAQSPVDIGGPLIVQLPRGAGGANTLEGSTPNATISGETLTVTGPFPPGMSPVQLAFSLRHDDAELTIEQSWPAPLEQVTVGIEKVGAVTMSSPQFASVDDRQAENGTPFLVGTGPALAAGSTLTLQLAGLPIQSPLPRYITIGLALAILGVGGWYAFTGREDAGRTRRRLIDRRDTLLGELAALEVKHRKATSPDPRYAARRQRILSELEQIYGELDEAGPQGGGEGIAA